MLQLWGVLLLLCRSMRVQGVHWWRRVLRSEGGAAAAMGWLFLLCRRPEALQSGAAAIVLMLQNMLRMGQVGYCNDGSWYWGCAEGHRVQQVRLLLRQGVLYYCAEGQGPGNLRIA